MTVKNPDKEPEAKPPDPQKFNWVLFWALLPKRLLYWPWTIITKCIMGLVCMELLTDGVIHLMSQMGKKLWKIPFLAFLNDYEATHRLTLASLFVLLPIICTFMLWSLIFKIYLSWDRFEKTFHRNNPERCRKVFLSLGAIVITADAGIFFAAFGSGSWGGFKYGPTTFLATALYSATTAFVSLIGMFLGEEIYSLKHHEKEV